MAWYGSRVLMCILRKWTLATGTWLGPYPPARHVTVYSAYLAVVLGCPNDETRLGGYCCVSVVCNGEKKKEGRERCPMKFFSTAMTGIVRRIAGVPRPEDNLLTGDFVINNAYRIADFCIPSLSYEDYVTKRTTNSMEDEMEGYEKEIEYNEGKNTSRD
ncbi:hypothetical protein U1Q18_047392 [Sarracenia purpurea var. burkii]